MSQRVLGALKKSEKKMKPIRRFKETTGEERLPDNQAAESDQVTVGWFTVSKR